MPALVVLFRLEYLLFESIDTLEACTRDRRTCGSKRFTMLPHGLRFKIVHEFDRCGNFCAVARKLGINVVTVRRWVQRHKATGGVDAKGGQGRKRAMSAQAAKLAANMLCNGEVGSARQVASVLFGKGLTRGTKPVHQSTIIRNAKRAAAAKGQPILATS
jgi:transposase-like protein